MPERDAVQPHLGRALRQRQLERAAVPPAARAGRRRCIGMSGQHAKAADRFVVTARVTEMPADDWNKLVDAKAAAKA